MPPKGRGRDTQQPKGKQRGATSEDHQDTIHFGLPQQVSAALQAISARSTAGLFKDAVTIPADQTAQQVAQARANQLDRINKRLAGNTKAKIALQEAANAWLGKYGQHLVALADRLNNIATTLDRDQSAAVTALQEATAALAVDPTEQVQSALASMGPIWSVAQEAEVLRLASSLRAFSAVGSGETVNPGVQGPLSPTLGSFASAQLGPCHRDPSGGGYRLLPEDLLLPHPNGRDPQETEWLPLQRISRPKGAGINVAIVIPDPPKALDAS